MRKMFAAFDSKAGVFMTPFFQARTELAVRSFAAALSRPDSEMRLFPEDFTLFELGSFDEESGKFEVHGAPVSVITGAVCASQMKEK